MNQEFYTGIRGKDGNKILSPTGDEIDPRLDLCSHSPIGFEWSYNGSGPAQAALAILADHLRSQACLRLHQCDDLATYYHQCFKRHVVAVLPPQWKMDVRVIEEFAVMECRQQKGETVDWSLWRASVRERCLVTELRQTEKCPG